MSFSKAFLLTAFTTAIHLYGVEPYPSGAGECYAGNLLADEQFAAPHRNYDIISGEIQDSAFKVTMDGNALFPSIPSNITAGERHRIRLKVPNSSDMRFRGFLIRIEDPRGIVDTFDYLFPLANDTDVQISEYCTDNEEVGGLTHTSNDEKKRVTGTLYPEFVEPGFVSELLMDVTIVVQNKSPTSEWYHSRYKVHSFSTTPTTPSPTVAATTASPPTDAPTITPTVTPTAIPTPTPTAMPTQTPTTFPTDGEAPSSIPTIAPTSFPSKLPAAEPTTAPTTAPSTVAPSVASEESEKTGASPTALPSVTSSSVHTCNPTATSAGMMNVSDSYLSRYAGLIFSFLLFAV